MPDTVIKVENVTKDYGGGRGIFDINLEVKKGEVFGYVGTNGSGKTTTIRSMMGFIKPKKGKSAVCGLDSWKRAPEIMRNVSYIPGEIAFPSLPTGTDFLKLQAEYLGVKDYTYMNRVIEMLQLDPSANLKRMSKGMKQKTAIVAALMGEKDVLVLDEPTTGLDPLMREAFLDLIREEKAKGHTVFMSSHIFEEIEEVCDRVAMIKDGRIVDVADLYELRHSKTRKYRIAFKNAEEAGRFALSTNIITELNGADCAVVIPTAEVGQFLLTLKEYTVKSISEDKITLQDYFIDVYQKGKKAMMETKVARHYSKPLMKQNIKSNLALIIVITLIMILMSTAMNFAMSKMGSMKADEDNTDIQAEFFSYLGAMATTNAMTGSELSYDDFVKSSNKKAYKTAFSMISKQSSLDLSVDGFQTAIDELSEGDISLDTYVKQFEYNYALMQNKGCFSGDDLTVEGMMSTMFEMMGIDESRIELMSTMDPTAMINQMYYTSTGLLPIFLLIVILANSLVVDQVDKGSMAYVLSTPTKRSAVAKTQMLFMIVVPLIILLIVCASRIFTTQVFFGEADIPKILALFAGMYILVEAVAAICYMGSCICNRSRKSMAFGGGLAVWFFLASLLSMFGSDMMVKMGMGAEVLGRFNYTTLVGLYDIDAISTIGTDSVDYAFVWKLGILAAIAVMCYTIGSLRFQKKDLPL